MLFALLLAALALPQSLLEASQDTTSASASDVRHGFVVYPGDLYSSTAGFGVGVGYRIRNLVQPGSVVHVRMAPAQHRGRYSVSAATADPASARLYGLVALYYETTGRQWFYGLGPAADPAERVGIQKETVQAEARMGIRFGPLLLQPSLRLLRHDVNGLYEADVVAGLDAASQAHVAYLLHEHPRQNGLVPGLGAVLEFGTPERHGLLVQSTARRFFGLNDVPGPNGRLRFDTYTFGVFGFVPVRLLGDHTLALRAILQTTARRADAPVPFYLLPELGSRLLPGIPRYRYFGNDVVVAGLEYRVPLFRLLQLGRVDLTLSAGVGGVYDDLADQFVLDVTLEDDLAAGRQRYPLRPAAGLGFRLTTRDGTRSRLTAVLGVSAEDWSIVTFRFIPHLTAVRPRVR